jgi:hypothetical protein
VIEFVERRSTPRDMKRTVLIALVALLPTASAWALPKPALPPIEPWMPWGFDPGGFDPWGQPPPPPPLPPSWPEASAAQPLFASRTHDTIRVHWDNNATAIAETILERRIGEDGEWTTIASFVGDDGLSRTYVDGNLERDTMYCYRTQAWSDSLIPYVSTHSCVYTRGPAPGGAAETGDIFGDHLFVWRGQVTVVTGTAAGAGTDDAVQVGMQDYHVRTTPHGNDTWLDKGGSDFAPGTARTWDLNVMGIDELRDIEEFWMYKDGDDAWCVEQIAFRVNGHTMFDFDFSSMPDGCFWIEGEKGFDNTFAVSHDELRAMPGWQNYLTTSPGFSFLHDEIESRVESSLGHIAHDGPLYWGDMSGAGWVEAQAGDEPGLVHVDVDIMADAPGWNPELDLDFDVAFEVTCEDADDGLQLVSVDIVPMNAHVDAQGSLFELGEALYCTFQWDWNCGEEDINEGIAGTLPPIFGPPFVAPFCPVVDVQPNGDVFFGL